MKAAKFAVLAAALFAAACASAGRSEQAREANETAYPQSVVARDLRFDTLSPQPLQAGRCGLFIWAQGSQQPLFIVVAYNTPAEALVRINGRDQTLPRTSFGGAAHAGHFEEQTYSDGRVTLTLDVTFDTGRPLRDGAAIRRGVVRVRDAEGWETIVPVGGLLACAS